MIEFIEPNVNWTAGKGWLDERDGQLYQTVRIGNQTWMAENLNYNVPGKTSDTYYNDDSLSYAEKFGRLYNNSTVLDGERTTQSVPSGVQGICPVGWHLPSANEWDTLFKQIKPAHSDFSSCSTCGGELKEETVLHWAAPNSSASNSTGFTARGGGYYSGSGYTGVYSYAYFWSSSYNPSSTGNNVFYYLSSSNDQAIYSSSSSGSTRYSVRCIKNEVVAYAGADQLIPGQSSTFLNADSLNIPYEGVWSAISGSTAFFGDVNDPKTLFSGMPGEDYVLEWKVFFESDTSRDTVLISMSDANVNWTPGKVWLDTRDMETYSTVVIGNQTWMAENLNYNVPGVSSDDYYNGDSTSYAEKFGRVYNQGTMMNGERISNTVPSGVQGVCPVAWHVPSQGEIDTLLTHIKSGHTPKSTCTTCGGELKETTTVNWDPPNTSASNSTGFTARGAGYYTGSSYAGVYDNMYFWSSSYDESSTSNFEHYYLSYNSDQVTSSSSSSSSARYSIRCLKDLPEANAGEDIFSASTSTTLDATLPDVPHSGQWTVISGGGSVADATDPKTSYFSGGTGEHYLEWKTFFQGDTSRDTVRVVLNNDGNNNWEPGETWYDVRDQESYKTVQIGNQVWMAENLNYNAPSGDSYYNSDSLSYADDYGRLYRAASSLNGERISNRVPSGVQGVCPAGWHLPSVYEWDTLNTQINAGHSALSSCTTCGVS
ncbi:hypothetical protein KFE98_15925 [bacterium SCSIO 12741]|nr:hypothetical protein KFE98_15925 [bacterium SCSIO 12741]